VKGTKEANIFSLYAPSVRLLVLTPMRNPVQAKALLKEERIKLDKTWENYKVNGLVNDEKCEEVFSPPLKTFYGGPVQMFTFA